MHIFESSQNYSNHFSNVEKKTLNLNENFKADGSLFKRDYDNRTAPAIKKEDAVKA